MVWIGDSFATGGNVINPLSANLKSHYGDGGVGWIDLYYQDSINAGVVVGASAGWTSQRNTTTATGLNLSDVRTSDVSTPAKLSVSVSASNVTLFYYTQPGGGTFEWWVDQDQPITIDTNAASPGIGSSTIGNLSDTTHVFQIQIVSAGSAGIALDGMDARSGNPGVVIHNLGSAGSNSGNWVSVDPNLWQTQLAALHPTLAVIMVSPNDQATSISVATQYANLSALIGRIRAAVPNAPIVLAPSPDNGLNRSPSMPAYNTSQQALAAALNVGYIDVLDPMQPFNPAWFNADLLHPNAVGGQLMADIVIQGLNLDAPPPAVTITPSIASIDALEDLPVTMTVHGGSVNPVPTGTVELWGGNYASGALTLSAGSAGLLIPGGSLVRGSDHLVALYTPDTGSSSIFMSAMGLVNETVTTPAPAPVFSVSPGIFTTVQTVTISDAAPNNAIYYTTDGTAPTTSSTRYSGPITVSSSQTLSAIATATGYTASPVTTAAYVIQFVPVASPVFSPTPGTYTSAQTLSISDATPGAAIYYTTDGTPPTSASSLYSGPLKISSSQTVAAVAIAPGHSPSGVTTAQFTINLPPSAFGIAGPNMTISRGALTNNTATITVTPSGGFTGKVALTAAISASPSGAVDLPTLSFGTTNLVNITPSGSGTAILTIATTPASSAALRVSIPGAALALLVLFGVPAGRRRWNGWVGMICLLFVLGAAAVACGGGSTSSVPLNPGTATGNYTITVTGTSGSLAETGSFILTVK